MDINMPYMDGYQASRIIKKKIKEKEFPPMKIIACTANSEVLLTRKALISGVDKVLCKPLTLI